MILALLELARPRNSTSALVSEPVVRPDPWSTFLELRMADSLEAAWSSSLVSCLGDVSVSDLLPAPPGTESRACFDDMSLGALESVTFGYLLSSYPSDQVSLSKVMNDLGERSPSCAGRCMIC